MRATIMSPVAIAAVALVTGAGETLAQRTVGFLHGLNDSPAVWYDAGGALASRFGFTPDYPSLPSQDFYENQMSSLGTRFGSSAIVVGHSNGGIVARYYGANHHVRGVVTYGSPNWGAPSSTTTPPSPGSLAQPRTMHSACST